MTLIPNHFERQLMQQLRGRGWVKASEFPPSTGLIGALLQKGWIEAQGANKDLTYRITEEAMMAKTALIPKYR